MYIENPEKLFRTPIFGSDGQLWIVTECTRLSNPESRGHTYEFKLVTDVPVKSSPNQVYYSMTKARSEKVELTMYKAGSEGIFEMICNGMVEHGYTKDIDTIDKFTYRLKEMLPTCLQ
jgi:hypothetical protein